MGRSTTKAIVPRAYIVTPIPQITVGTANTDLVSRGYFSPMADGAAALSGTAARTYDLGTNRPAQALPGNLTLIRRRRSSGHCIQAVGYSATTATTDGSNTARFEAVHPLMTAIRLHNAASSGDVVTTNGNQCGVYRPHFSLNTTAHPTALTGDKIDFVGSDAVRGAGMNYDVGTTAVVLNHGGYVVYSPSVIFDAYPGLVPAVAGSSTHIADPRARPYAPQINNAGPVAGYYSTLPFGGVDVAVSQANLAIRRITAPFPCRIHAINFMAVGGTGVANTVKLRNVTQGVDICAHTNFSGTDLYIPAASLSNRNINRDDILEVFATTGATGFTQLSAVVICHTTGHVNALPGNDSTGPVASTAEPTADELARLKRGNARKTKSGPCAGSVLALPFMGSAVAAGSETRLCRLTVPADGRLLFVQVVSNAATAPTAAVFRLENNDADSLYPGFATTDLMTNQGPFINATAGQHFHTSSFTVVPTVLRGTKLDLYINVTTNPLTYCYAVAYLHVTGHVNASPASD